MTTQIPGGKQQWQKIEVSHQRSQKEPKTR
jgi:hypothetical protein